VQGVVVNPLPRALVADPDDPEAYNEQLAGAEREALVVKAGRRRANQVRDAVLLATYAYGCN
jgi:hypothetical protein